MATSVAVNVRAVATMIRSAGSPWKGWGRAQLSASTGRVTSARCSPLEGEGDVQPVVQRAVQRELPFRHFTAYLVKAPPAWRIEFGPSAA